MPRKSTPRGMAFDCFERGEGIVIGDMTGFGHGRIAAMALTRYARRQNLMPIFVTQNPTLYLDTLRDCSNIGTHSPERPLRILVTHAGLKGTKTLVYDDGTEIAGVPIRGPAAG